MNGDGEREEDKRPMSCDDNWSVDTFKASMESCNVSKTSFKSGSSGLTARASIKSSITS